MMYSYYVYIMTNKPRGILYVGVTNNLALRVFGNFSITRGSYVKAAISISLV